MQDIRLTGDYNFAIKNGDFVVNEATIQNQALIISTVPGEFKSSPEVGVALYDQLLSEEPKQILNSIKRQLEYDGMKVKELRFKNGKIEVNARYGKTYK